MSEARPIVHRFSSRPARGMTLMEVIVAITLMALMMTALLVFFWETLRTREAAAERARTIQLARQLLHRIESELRGTVGFDEVRFPVEQRLVGDRRMLTFLTTTLPADHQYVFLRESDDPPPAQHDLTLLTYRLDYDLQSIDREGQPRVGGIIRSEKRTLNQFVVEEDDPLQIRHELWSPELQYIEFRYFDGAEWTTTWQIDQGNTLPHLVQVTVGFRPASEDELRDNDLADFPLDEFPFGSWEEHPDRYSVIVRLPWADQFFGARMQRVSQEVADQFGLGGLSP